MTLNDTTTPSTENNGTPATETPPATPAASNTPPSQTPGNTDDFGYEVPAKADEPAKEGEKPPEKAPEKKEEAIKDPATGYGKEPPKVEEVPPPPKEEPKVDLGYEIEIKDMDPKELTKIKEFAKANALTKEAATALANLKKSEIDTAKAAMLEAQANYKKAEAKIKSDWYHELKTDPVFGGDKFDASIVKAERVLGEFLPETKKALTERGSMLPPYVMQDLNKLAEHLYASEKLTTGEPTIEDKPAEDTGNDYLDFYKS